MSSLPAPPAGRSYASWHWLALFSLFGAFHVDTAHAVSATNVVESFDGVGSIHGSNGWEEQPIGNGGSGTLNGLGQYVLTDTDNGVGHGIMLIKRTLGEGDFSATVSLDDIDYADTSQFLMKIADNDSPAGQPNAVELKISTCCTFDNTARPVVKVNSFNGGAFTTRTDPGGNSSWPAGIGIIDGSITIGWTELPGSGGQWDFSWNFLLDNFSTVADSFTIPQAEYDTVDASPNRRLELIWELFHTTNGQVSSASLEHFEIAVPAALPGDYNDDGVVHLADYTRWRDKLGVAAALPNDVTPGFVDQTDYLEWRDNFGATAAAAQRAESSPLQIAREGTPAPEPSSALLLAISLGTLIYAQRR